MDAALVVAEQMANPKRKKKTVTKDAAVSSLSKVSKGTPKKLKDSASITTERLEKPKNPSQFRQQNIDAELNLSKKRPVRSVAEAAAPVIARIAKLDEDEDNLDVV